jgi:hypothetical protein
MNIVFMYVLNGFQERDEPALIMSVWKGQVFNTGSTI